MKKPQAARRDRTSRKKSVVRRPNRKRRLAEPSASSRVTGQRKHGRHFGIETFTARELQGMVFPPVRYAVDGYIAEGLTLLGGKPKIGKSWMAVDFGMAIARGGLALGSIPCKQGRVLYCALEDNKRRLQRRMRKLYGDEGGWPKSFHFTTQLKRLDEGGLNDLREWILDHDPTLVIIDTLACVRPRTRRETGGGYDADYAALAPLQEMAGELGVCIVVIHHLRKMIGDDPLDMISGTTGLTGAVDNILVLGRNSGGVTLYGRGREIEEIETALEMNQGAWKVLGPASEVRRSEEREAIINVLADADKPMGPKAIADTLKADTANIKQLLFKMAKDGEVMKKSRGQYVLPEN